MPPVPSSVTWRVVEMAWVFCNVATWLVAPASVSAVSSWPPALLPRLPSEEMESVPSSMRVPPL
ncbi:hypothetical protein FHU14_005014 [Mesorhizobium sp. RMAD-H1]|nr:hypothetical protein [Mesorhizobium sp. RMAD-H1]